MEVWGGIECSVNRIDESYLDQFTYQNLYDRPELLDEIINLGIKTLRFPILWEKNWTDENEPPTWLVQEHLALLKRNDIHVIAGLVHHGSGPRYAEIQHDCFPEKLAAYAKRVAIAFPWITDYTPINEPLTTARFCGLYGLWYPLAKNAATFLQILINECKGTILAMRAIREVNPKAKLVFTEDLTKIHGTSALKEQVDFENHRRWLSIDLLCGKVNREHPLWGYLLAHQATMDQLHFFMDNPMPPDVLGFNYYITSERYLDHHLADYPLSMHGGNGKIAYADIEAVRQPDDILAGPTNLMREAWERYRLPLAITEAHLCCGREDQLRWLHYIWKSCNLLGEEGIPIVAVTFWSLFGAYGWDKLLTAEKGRYESGAFDQSAGNPRPTAIAHYIKALTHHTPFPNPLIHGEGWWKRKSESLAQAVPLLITGASGTLGTAFAKICSQRNISFVALNRNEVDISDIEQIEQAIQKYQPWAIINTAGYVNVDAAEVDVERCFSANAIGAINLAKACANHRIQFLSFSSDLVFDGKKSSAYAEEDYPSALNQYGHSKMEAERQVFAYNPSALLIRTSAFFGPWDSYNFVAVVLKSLKEGKDFKAIADVTITATYVPHLVEVALNLLIDEQAGIWHLANEGRISWYEFAVAVAKRSGNDTAKIQGISLATANLPAQRPQNSALTSTKGRLMPSLEKGLDDYFMLLDIL